MKSALIALAFLAAPSVFALQVGDSATYSQTLLGKVDIVTNQVVYINGDEFTSVTLADGTPLSQTKGSIAKYDQTQSQILPLCVSQGGKLEAVTTPAGTFNSCHLSKGGNDSYMSPDAPFSLVKWSIHSNGIDSETVLSSMVRH